MVTFLVGLLLIEFILIGVDFFILHKLFLTYFISFLFFNLFLFTYLHIPLRFFLLLFRLILCLF